MHTQVLEVRTGAVEAVVDLTDRCAEFLAGIEAEDGLLHVWVPHATAGLAVIETGAGSEADLLTALLQLLPPRTPWKHRHGAPGHGRDHVLPAVCAPYASVPVVAGQMVLGTWQSVCLVDTNVDNPVRSLRLSFLPA